MELQTLYKKTTVYMTVAAVIMTALVIISLNFLKPAAAKETGVRENTAETVIPKEKEAAGDDLLFSRSEENSEYIWIPVPEGTGAADVSIENHYMDSQLWVVIASEEKDYYTDNAITGDLSDILGGSISKSQGELTLKLDMAQIYEYNTIFEDGVLYVEKVSPRAMYDRIVVIDPAGSVPDEFLQEDSMSPSGICIDIASKLKDMLEEEGIRVYITSLDDREIDDQARLSLADQVKPDMYIRIETAYDSDSMVYGTQTVYNGTYFIPGFGSVELADLLEKNVTTSIGGKVDGLCEAAEGDTVIQKATVPAAAIKVGYYTNIQENILLNRDDYRSRIAQGIYDAVIAGYEEKQ